MNSLGRVARPARPIVAAGALCALLVLAACSGQSGGRGGAGSGESIGTTSPPGSMTPGGGSGRGQVGKAASVGDWTVLVRQTKAKAGRDTSGGTEPGTVGKGRDRAATVSVVVLLRQASADSLKVMRSDWTLEDGMGGTYDPQPTKHPKLQGDATVQRNRPAAVHMSFKVPDAGGAYVLRFEPAQGGPGVLRVAIP